MAGERREELARGGSWHTSPVRWYARSTSERVGETRGGQTGRHNVFADTKLVTVGGIYMRALVQRHSRDSFLLLLLIYFLILFSPFLSTVPFPSTYW